MENKNNSFNKSERLYLRKDISTLFAKNLSFICFPLRVLYRIEKIEDIISKPSILISVAKRNFKRANKRNYIKRVIRESYRLNKKELLDFAAENNLCLHIAYLYVGKEILDNSLIEKAMTKSISTIISQYESSKKVSN